MLVDQTLPAEYKSNTAVRAHTARWSLPELEQTPVDEWDRMRRFVGINPVEREAMLNSVPILFRRGYELVVANYDYLLANPDTAQVLGWENGVDLAHLEERRRFLTVWLARLLGMDFSHDLAMYLFKAGQMHAGYGPRHVHIPSVYVTGAASLMSAAFARLLNEEAAGQGWVAEAVAGWGKVLAMHLHMMLLGYEAARRLSEGSMPVKVTFYGRMRAVTGAAEITVGAYAGIPVTMVLKKLFEFYPQAREEALDIAWTPGEHLDAFGNPWMTVHGLYLPKPGWRVLLNGRDLTYLDDAQRIINAGDSIQVFPPGR